MNVPGRLPETKLDGKMIWCRLPCAVCKATRPGGSARSGKRAAEAAAAAAASAIRFVGVRLRGTLRRSAGLVAKLGEIPSDGGAFGVIPLDATGPADTGVVGLGDTLTGSAGFSGVVGIRDGVAAAGRSIRL